MNNVEKGNVNRLLRWQTFLAVLAVLATLLIAFLGTINDGTGEAGSTLSSTQHTWLSRLITSNGAQEIILALLCCSAGSGSVLLPGYLLSRRLSHYKRHRHGTTDHTSPLLFFVLESKRVALVVLCLGFSAWLLHPVVWWALLLGFIMTLQGYVFAFISTESTKTDD